MLNKEVMGLRENSSNVRCGIVEGRYGILRIGVLSHEWFQMPVSKVTLSGG